MKKYMKVNLWMRMKEEMEQIWKVKVKVGTIVKETTTIREAQRIKTTILCLMT